MKDVEKAIEILDRLAKHINDALEIAEKAKEALEGLKDLDDEAKKKKLIDAVAEMLKKIVDKKAEPTPLPGPSP